MRRTRDRQILFTIFAVLVLFPAIVAAEGQLIFGVGVGVFAIGLGGIIAILICIAGLATPYPLLVAFIAVLIPIILFLIFYFAPTVSSSAEDITSQTDVTDTSFGWRVAFFVFGCLGMLISLLFLFLESCMTSLKAPRVDSGVIFHPKEIDEAALEKDRAIANELFGESPNRSFDNMPNRGSYHNENQIRSPLPENESMARLRRRMGETTGTQPPETEENLGLVRRRMD